MLFLVDLARPNDRDVERLNFFTRLLIEERRVFGIRDKVVVLRRFTPKPRDDRPAFRLKRRNTLGAIHTKDSLNGRKDGKMNFPFLYIQFCLASGMAGHAPRPETPAVPRYARPASAGRIALIFFC